MPKSYVITKSDQKRADEQGGELPAILVGWHSNGWVQLASVLKQSVEGSTSELEAKVDQGQFIDLDRDACNQLIRMLRRARDAAYGRDE